MKIIRSSVNERIECECGCYFIYNKLDIKGEYPNGNKRRSEYYDDFNDCKKEDIINTVYCPECNKKHIINRK